jgi:hypothetical protein
MFVGRESEMPNAHLATVLLVAGANGYRAGGLVPDDAESLAQILKVHPVDFQHLLPCPRQDQVHTRQPAGQLERFLQQVPRSGDHPGETRRPGGAGGVEAADVERLHVRIRRSARCRRCERNGRKPVGGSTACGLPAGTLGKAEPF